LSSYARRKAPNMFYARRLSTKSAADVLRKAPHMLCAKRHTCSAKSAADVLRKAPHMFCARRHTCSAQSVKKQKCHRVPQKNKKRVPHQTQTKKLPPSPSSSITPLTDHPRCRHHSPGQGQRRRRHSFSFTPFKIAKRAHLILIPSPTKTRMACHRPPP